MLGLFKALKQHKEYENEIYRIFKSIDFNTSFNNMPTLEFNYSFKDRLLLIDGPVDSFHVHTAYRLKYDPIGNDLYLNDELLNDAKFKNYYKVIQDVYQKLQNRDKDIEMIRQSHERLVNSVTLSQGHSSGSSTERSKKSHSPSHRNRSDFNTDAFVSSVSDSGSSSSSSRDRDCGD